MMVSEIYSLLRFKYKVGRLSKNEIWQFVDAGVIEEDAAESICGPREE